MPRGEPFDVDAFLARPLVARVATAGPTVRPVWYLWEEGAFWWLTGAYARLPALLAQDPRVALVVDSCDLATGEVRQVTAHGEAELVDFDVGDPDTPRLAILVDGELVGLIQFLEEDEPDYRHAAIDLFVAPSHHGSGVGTDALRTLVRHLVEERGHHRIIIDPATDNVAAVRCYEKVGFRPVGVLHGEWFDHSAGAWRDALMMELVVGLADA